MAKAVTVGREPPPAATIIPLTVHSVLLLGYEIAMLALIVVAAL